jgi:hypothetical protein
VPAVNVCNFVGKNSGQLGFILNQIDQPLIDIDIASGCGKGIDGRAPNNREFKFKGGFIAVAEYPFAEESEEDVGPLIF